MKEGIGYRKEQLAHADVLPREFDPSYRAETLPANRLRRIKLSGNGELNRLIADALRGAEKPLTSHDIAHAIVTAKRFGRESIKWEVC
jgi:hypothetical protein